MNQHIDREDAIERETGRTHAQFIEALRDCLRRDGVSQAKLAARLGVSPSRVSMLMTGNPTCNLRLRTLVRLAAGLGLRLRISIEEA